MKAILKKICNSNVKNVLIVFPHPDDEIFSCISLLNEVKKLGIYVDCLWTTTGYPKPVNLNKKSSIEYRKKRTAEFIKAKSYLSKLVNRSFSWNYKSREFLTKFDSIKNRIIKLINKNNYDSIFVCPLEGAHPDHDLLNLALFLISMKNLSKKNLSVFEYSSYHIAKGIFSNNEFLVKSDPLLELPITTKSTTMKKKLIRIYKSQTILSKFEIKNETFRKQQNHFEQYMTMEKFYETWQSDIDGKYVNEFIKSKLI